jgi:hypothetical protein
MTSKEVEQAIRALGLAVTRVNGKWRINHRGGKEATTRRTTMTPWGWLGACLSNRRILLGREGRVRFCR